MSFWPGLLTGVMVGVVVGFVASYPVGYLRELGRQQAVLDGEARESKKREVAEERVAAALASEREEERQKRSEFIEALRHQRVGRRFVERSESKDELGILLTVIDLDAQQPEQRVLVEYSAMQGGVKSASRPSRVVMDWKSLVAAPDVQRHFTARVIARSTDDGAGWIQFEELSAD